MQDKNNIIICLENIRSVYNVGSLFRTGEGFGLNNFALVGITPTPLDRFGKKRKDFIKTALGAEDRIKWEYFENANTLLHKYPDYKIISIEINNNSEDIKNIDNFIFENKDKKFLIFLGSEVEGVSEEIIAKSNKVYHIPMTGEKESFNVSVAGGIVMYIISNIKNK